MKFLGIFFIVLAAFLLWINTYNSDRGNYRDQGINTFLAFLFLSFGIILQFLK